MDFRGLFNKLKEQVTGPTAEPVAEEPLEEEVTPGSMGQEPPARPTPTGKGNPAGLQTRDPSGTGGRSRTHGVVQNEKDDSVYNMRSEHIARIEAMFGEFGPTVSSYMLTQSLTDGGVRRVLMKLELQSRGRDGADLALIENWILRHGADSFCERVKLRNNRSAPPPPPSAPPNPSREALNVTVRPLEGNRPGHQAPQTSQNRVGPRPRPVGQENASSQGAPASHLNKISITPLGLAGKDVQRVHQRPESGPQPPPLSTDSLVRDAIEKTGKDVPGAS